MIKGRHEIGSLESPVKEVHTDDKHYYYCQYLTMMATPAGGGAPLQLPRENLE